jgi:hypothetical protein
MLVPQIKDAQAFVAAGSQAFIFGQRNCVKCLYTIIHNSDMVINTCCKWCCGPESYIGQKDMDQFQGRFRPGTHLARGNDTHTTPKSCQLSQCPNDIPNFANKMGEALANLATATTTAADQDMLHSATQAHTELGEMTHTTPKSCQLSHNAHNVIANFANKMGEALANLATATTTAADQDICCIVSSLQATNKAIIQQNTVVQQFQASRANHTTTTTTNNNNNNHHKTTTIKTTAAAAAIKTTTTATI